MCRPAALAAWLGGRAAVEKRLPNQGMCCLFYTQNHPLVDWAGCGLLVARCAGCSHACVAKYFAGKKCVVCVWQFGALLVWWVGNQPFDACLWELSWEHARPCWPLSRGCYKVNGYGEKSIEKVSA